MTKPEDLNAFTISAVRGKPALSWANGQTFCLPLSLFATGVRETRPDKPIEIVLMDREYNVSEELITNLRLMNAFTVEQPLSARLPFSYHKIPSFVRSGIAKIVSRLRRKFVDSQFEFPRWPLDLSVDFLTDLAGKMQKPFLKQATPVLLTHDIDSPEGLRNLGKFLDVEEAVGARSVAFVVPCAWQLDNVLLSEAVARGHELGVHGVNHSNKTSYCTPNERIARLNRTTSFVERYKVKGYRSPSLIRTYGLVRDLASLFVYDSSIPTSGGLFPVPNNGCASARPFWIEGICELPLSMPRDGSMIFMGYKPDDIFAMWIRCAELISNSGGMVVLLTHCENRFSGNTKMFEIYKRFLCYLFQSDKYSWSSPSSILDRIPRDTFGSL